MSYEEKVKAIQSEKHIQLKQRKELSKAILYQLKGESRDLSTLNKDVHEYLTRNKGMLLPRADTQELFYLVLNKMINKGQIARHMNRTMITYSGEELCYLYTITDTLKDVKYENNLTFSKLWEHLKSKPSYEDMEKYYFKYDEVYIRKVLGILMSAGYLSILNSKYIIDGQFIRIFEI